MNEQTGRPSAKVEHEGDGCGRFSGTRDCAACGSEPSRCDASGRIFKPLANKHDWCGGMQKGNVAHSSGRLVLDETVRKSRHRAMITSRSSGSSRMQTVSMVVYACSTTLRVCGPVVGGFSLALRILAMLKTLADGSGAGHVKQS